MSALGIPQIAVVHGMSVAGEVDEFPVDVLLLTQISSSKVVPMSPPWQMRT